MKDNNNNNNNNNTTITSDKQRGGITAQNVTINNYSSWSKGLGKLTLNFKTKTMRWSLIGAVALSTLIVFGRNILFAPEINSKDQFYNFVLVYLKSVSESKPDAEEFFTDKISVFYKEKNITPQRVNQIRKITDYTKGEYDVDKESIAVNRKFSGITYWRFNAKMLCYRPSLSKYEKCVVEMEYGINDDGRIASIEQINYWDYKLSEEKPTL